MDFIFCFKFGFFFSVFVGSLGEIKNNLFDNKSIFEALGIMCIVWLVRAITLYNLFPMLKQVVQYLITK